ncbi:hypothetical protein ABZS29_33090 [Kribbella sp. NPDC005582]|uniref:hypothetical protein n=1 Tax=Kribbella sp. NPDC005582 TaxID=3156893 RepID=UPI0033B62AA8
MDLLWRPRRWPARGGGRRAPVHGRVAGHAAYVVPAYVVPAYVVPAYAGGGVDSAGG